MHNFTIDKLNIYSDLDEISSWDDEFWNSHKYKSIRKYILEDDIYFSLRELITVNYDAYTIGKDEEKASLVIRNNDKIIGFIISSIIDKKTKNPEWIIQYIAMHPNYQNKGYGSEVLREIITNPVDYLGINISKVFTRIEESNKVSKKTFSNLGFSFNQTGTNYLVAKLNILEDFKEK